MQTLDDGTVVSERSMNSQSSVKEGDNGMDVSPMYPEQKDASSPVQVYWEESPRHARENRSMTPRNNASDVNSTKPQLAELPCECKSATPVRRQNPSIGSSPMQITEDASDNTLRRSNRNRTQTKVLSHEQRHRQTTTELSGTVELVRVAKEGLVDNETIEHIANHYQMHRAACPR